MDWVDYFSLVQRIGSRYFLAAGIAFLMGYVILRNKVKAKKIQSRFPENKDYFREIGYSISTILIFALVPLLILKNDAIRPYTQFYTDIRQHGTFYFIAAFPIMLILHDSYFYWTHRLMHHPAIFRYFHLVHHKSTNPSPWAAYSFHPLEAIVEAGIFPLLLFVVPIHTLHLFIFFIFMILYNVYGHLGYELYPKNFSRHPIGKWINTSVNHNQHHQYFKGNYGLYFLFWDRIMGTIRKDYEDRFEEVKSK
jgi:lathosterol oxidase